jgi:uncharacterized protein with HEPN domain
MLDKDYYILLSLLETLEKISRYTKTYCSAEELFENDRDFDATMMNFIVIGEHVGKLSDQIKSRHPEMNWQKIYGLRNILAHHYFGINVDMIWQIIQDDIPQFKEDLKRMIVKYK